MKRFLLIAIFLGLYYSSLQCQVIIQTYDYKEYYPNMFIGYYGNVTSNAPIGFSLGCFLAPTYTKIGIFINYKFSAGYEVETFHYQDNNRNNLTFEKHKSISSAEAGFCFQAMGSLFMYTGVGHSSTDFFEKYYDSDGNLEDMYLPDNTIGNWSFIGGFIYFTPYYFYLQAGLDTYPGGLNVGVGFFF